MKTKTTKQQKLIRRLSTGKRLSVNEAKTKLGISNVSAEIWRLRNKPYNMDIVTENVNNKTTYKVAC